jgi:hypothetical protein
MKKAAGAYFRPRVIGPATIVALLLAVVIGYMNFSRHTPTPLRTAKIQSAEHRPLPAPDAAQMLKEKERLGLTSDQAARLAALNKEWVVVSKPALAEMRRNAAKLEASLTRGVGRRETGDGEKIEPRINTNKDEFARIGRRETGDGERMKKTRDPEPETRNPEERATVEDIQKQAAPYSDSVAAYIKLRDEYNRRAREALTPAQRRTWAEISGEMRDKK